MRRTFSTKHPLHSPHCSDDLKASWHTTAPRLSTQTFILYLHIDITSYQALFGAFASKVSRLPPSVDLWKPRAWSYDIAKVTLACLRHFVDQQALLHWTRSWLVVPSKLLAKLSSCTFTLESNRLPIRIDGGLHFVQRATPS